MYLEDDGAYSPIYGEIEGTRCNVFEDSRGEVREYKSLSKENLLDEEDYFSLNFEISLLFSEFNEMILIEKPEGAEDLMEIIEDEIGGIMKSVMPGEFSDSDKDGLSDNLEDYYDTDVNNPDTDGDGYTDGQEIENGYDPLIAGDAKLNISRFYK